MKPWEEFLNLVQLHQQYGGKTLEQACEMAWHQATGNAGLVQAHEVENSNKEQL